MKHLTRHLTKYVTAAAMLAVTATSAQAQTVTYSTQYSFTGLPGSFLPTNFSTFGSGGNTATLTFTGKPGTTVSAPSFMDYGMVAVTGTSGTGFTFTGQQVFLQILQTGPSAGTATIAGSLSGTTVDGTQSTAIINWNQPSRFATIGTTTYEVERLGQGQTSINAMATGPQTIRGFVTSTVSTTATPEPASMVLLGTGLLGVIGVVRRKRTSSAS